MEKIFITTSIFGTGIYHYGIYIIEEKNVVQFQIDNEGFIIAEGSTMIEAIDKFKQFIINSELPF